MVTYDGSAKAAGLKVYVDGALNAARVRRDNLTGSVASTEPWRIAWKGTGIGFEGGMDEVRLFDRALTAEEVGALYWRDFLEGTLAVPRAQRTRQQSDKLEAYYLAHAKALRRRASSRRRPPPCKPARRKCGAAILSVSVMHEMDEAA